MIAEESNETTTFRQRLYDKVDETVRAMAAGMSVQDLRGMFRGEPPGRPNPRYRVHTNSFWFHIRPRWYPKSVTRFTYTLALGWLSAFLAIVLGISGFILMIYYTPSTDMAYVDMLNIIEGVPLGKIVRDVHRLAGELMVITVALHMVRVFVTASYKPPRSFNWMVGVVLLLITVGFSYSGYLLPWDQIAYWAITIGTSVADAVPVLGPHIQQWLLGGQAVGQLALLRFYTLHVIILSIALVIMFGVHYYKVVKQGISLPVAVEAKGGKDEERIPFVPDILGRELMWVMLATLALLIPVIWGLYSAPLEAQANPFMTPLHSTAPWYFLWIQGLIKLPDIFGGIIEGKLVYGIIVPTTAFAILFALPYIDRNPSRRLQDRKLALSLGALVIVALAVLTFMGTPAYGLGTPAAEEIALEFVPFDREGAIHELGWDDLVDGVYDTNTFSGDTVNKVRLTELMMSLTDAMAAKAVQLPAGVATLTITTWQRDLKRVDLEIVWEAEGVEHTFQEYTYVHKDTIG